MEPRAGFGPAIFCLPSKRFGQAKLPGRDCTMDAEPCFLILPLIMLVQITNKLS